MSDKYIVVKNNEPVYLRFKKQDHHICMKATSAFTHSRVHADVRYKTKKETKAAYSALRSAMAKDPVAAMKQFGF
jgi:hypothetical protein